MRRLFTLLMGVLISANIYAQKLELGLFLGVSNYIGDLESKYVGSGEGHIAYGFFARYQVLEYLSVRANVYQGELSGSDDKASVNKARNLSFRTDILELGFQAEFNPLPLLFDEPSIFAPYGFVGISGFHYKPYAYFEGEWHELKPLGTEGQTEEEKYKLFQIAIPMGVGTNIRISEYSSLGLEVGLRKTFTDYIDDVSGQYPDIDALQESNPLAASLSYRTPEYFDQESFDNPEGNRRGASGKDWYMFSGMTFSFNLAGLLSIGSGPGNYSAF